ncbi:MAG TPA: TolC family protein [Terriglobales bacterium]|nr:TolC family protein [Terriglobales bacterium]
MKAIRVLVYLLAATALCRAQADDPYAPVAALLPQPHAERQPAARPMTLEELEAAALVNNPEVRAAARRVAVLEARQPAAGALDDPWFMYRGWGVPLERPWDFNQAQNMFMLGRTLPGPGKRDLRSQVASRDVEVARAELEAVRRAVAAEVRKAFYELLLNADQLRLHDQQVALARQGIESARIKYVVGRVPQQDVLKAQIALTRLVDHLVMLEQEGSLARVRLNALLGRDPAAPLEVAGSYAPLAGLPSVAELQRRALERRPELVAARAAVQRSQAARRLADKAYSPDYNLSAGYMLQPDGSRFRNSYMAELSINLPWLNRRKHDAEIATAQAELSLQETEYESRRVTVFREIQEALVRARSAEKLVRLYRDTLRPQARAVLQATAAAYETDRTDFLNLLDGQNTTIDVEVSYFRALAEFEARIADLERAVGAPLPRGTSARVAESEPEVNP